MKIKINNTWLSAENKKEPTIFNEKKYEWHVILFDYMHVYGRFNDMDVITIYFKNTTDKLVYSGETLNRIYKIHKQDLKEEEEEEKKLKNE
jgi:hypothetical protein